jgi:hypothetical protein
VRWKLHEFNYGDGYTNNPFSGYPRPELEEAWDGLLGSKLLSEFWRRILISIQT